MGDVAKFTRAVAEEVECIDLNLDFNPLFDAFASVVAAADRGRDNAAVLTAFLARAARGIEEIGHFRVEHLPDNIVRVACHPSADLLALFQSPEGAA